jgi:hypothetical protein
MKAIVPTAAVDTKAAFVPKRRHSSANTGAAGAEREQAETSRAADEGFAKASEPRPPRAPTPVSRSGHFRSMPSTLFIPRALERLGICQCRLRVQREGRSGQRGRPLSRNPSRDGVAALRRCRRPHAG